MIELINVSSVLFLIRTILHVVHIFLILSEMNKQFETFFSLGNCTNSVRITTTSIAVLGSNTTTHHPEKRNLSVCIHLLLAMYFIFVCIRERDN